MMLEGKYTMITHNNTALRDQSLTCCILNISQLPAAPTFDWATQAANAIAPIHPSTSLGVVIARHNTQTNTLRVEAAGVHTSNHADSLEARCPLERLGSSPINLHQPAIESGYIGPVSRLLPQWFASKASLPWTSPQQSPTLLAYAPLSYNTTHTNPHPSPDHDSTTDPEILALLILACPHSNHAGPINPTALATTLAVLAHKASTAIYADDAGTIPWLTQREQTILDHLIEGDSVRVIAEIVDRSPHTVHDHVKNLHRKLGASSRGQLIAKALGHPQGSTTIDLITPIIDPELIQAHTQVGVAELKPAAPTPPSIPSPALSRHPAAE